MLATKNKNIKTKSNAKRKMEIAPLIIGLPPN